MQSGVVAADHGRLLGVQFQHGLLPEHELVVLAALDVLVAGAVQRREHQINDEALLRIATDSQRHRRNRRHVNSQSEMCLSVHRAQRLKPVPRFVLCEEEPEKSHLCSVTEFFGGLFCFAFCENTSPD